MMLKTILSVVFIINVNCQPFGVKWRLGKLEEKYFKEMTELKEGFGIVVEMINNKTCACGANSGTTEYGKTRELGDKTADGLYNDIGQKASEILTVIKRAFVEEKENIRKTVQETRHEYYEITSNFKDEMDKVRSEIQENVSKQFKALERVQLITESNTRRIDQLSNSVANVVDDISATSRALNVNQDNIKQLTNTVRELQTHLQKPSAFLSLVKQNIEWQCHAGSCYFIGKSATWEESKQKCHEFGAKLAEVESEEENNYLVNFVANQGITGRGVFLGATDIEKEGVWKWDASNKKVDETYNNFKGPEPNGGANENCLELQRPEGWAWNDIGCSRRIRFICEIIENEDT